MSTPRIERVLWLCTSHIPAEAAAKLNEAEALGPSCVADIPGWCGYSLEYGWLTWVPNPKNNDDNYDEAEPWLKAMYDFALKHDCGWIRFDADESEIAELPTFEWES